MENEKIEDKRKVIEANHPKIKLAKAKHFDDCPTLRLVSG